MRVIAAGLAGVVAFLGVLWIVQGNDFFMYRYFGPKYEDTRREIFEKSKAYNEGMVQELQNMQFEYIKASPEHKAALASVILHRSANYDLSDRRVPAELRDFVEQLRRERSLR